MTKIAISFLILAVAMFSANAAETRNPDPPHGGGGFHGGGGGHGEGGFRGGDFHAGSFHGGSAMHFHGGGAHEHFGHAEHFETAHGEHFEHFFRPEEHERFENYYAPYVYNYPYYSYGLGYSQYGEDYCDYPYYWNGVDCTYCPSPDVWDGYECTSSDPSGVSGNIVDPPAQNNASNGREQISGEITELWLTMPQAETGQRVLAKIWMGSRHFSMVDLGSLKELNAKELKPSVGEQVAIKGHEGRTGKSPILVAEDVTLGNKEYVLKERAGCKEEAESTSYRPPSRAAAPSTAPSMLIQGTIVRVQDIALKGLPEKHVFAKVRTNDGAVAAIDLGTRPQLPKIKLDPGTVITASGPLAYVDGKPVLFADSVAEATPIERIATKEGKPTEAAEKAKESCPDDASATSAKEPAR